MQDSEGQKEGIIGSTLRSLVAGELTWGLVPTFRTILVFSYYTFCTKHLGGKKQNKILKEVQEAGTSTQDFCQVRYTGLRGHAPSLANCLALAPYTLPFCTSTGNVTLRSLSENLEPSTGWKELEAGNKEPPPCWILPGKWDIVQSLYKRSSKKHLTWSSISLNGNNLPNLANSMGQKETTVP